MTGISTYLCPTCGVIVRTDRRTLHEADHTGQKANTTAITGLTSRVATLEAGGGGGGGGGGSERASFHQATPAAEWTWVHGLGGYPPVALFADDDPQVPVFTDIAYTDENTVVVEWPEPTSGWAYI